PPVPPLLPPVLLPLPPAPPVCSPPPSPPVSVFPAGALAAPLHPAIRKIARQVLVRPAKRLVRCSPMTLLFQRQRHGTPHKICGQAFAVNDSEGLWLVARGEIVTAAEAAPYFLRASSKALSSFFTPLSKEVHTSRLTATRSVGDDRFEPGVARPL